MKSFPRVLGEFFGTILLYCALIFGFIVSIALPASGDASWLIVIPGLLSLAAAVRLLVWLLRDWDFC